MALPARNFGRPSLPLLAAVNRASASEDEKIYEPAIYRLVKNSGFAGESRLEPRTVPSVSSAALRAQYGMPFSLTYRQACALHAFQHCFISSALWSGERAATVLWQRTFHQAPVCTSRSNTFYDRL